MENVTIKTNVVPGPDEAICLPSYVIAATRVGGGPGERTGFWPAYREALATNLKTRYVNRRTQLCGPLVEELYRRYPHFKTEPVYFRSGNLVQERVAEVMRESNYLGAGIN